MMICYKWQVANPFHVETQKEVLPLSLLPKLCRASLGSWTWSSEQVSLCSTCIGKSTPMVQMCHGTLLSREKSVLGHGVAHLRGEHRHLLHPGETTVLRRPHTWSETNVRVGSQLLDSWFRASPSCSCLSRNLGCCCHFLKDRRTAHRALGADGVVS